MKSLFLVGRAIFGGFFLYSGINHLLKKKELAQYAGSKQIPSPDAAVMLSGLALLLGGTSVIVGAKPKLGTAAIVGFLAAVSPTMHKFWKIESPEQRRSEMVNFTKNLALLGAAVGLMGVREPWPSSLSVNSPAHRIGAGTAVIG